MSRFDGANNGDAMPWALWEANAERALAGKRGQKALREFKAALVALPKRELIDGNLIELGWDPNAPDDADAPTLFEGVCAVGAYALYKGQTTEQLRKANMEYSGEDGEGDCWSTAEAGQKVGLTYTLAWELSYRNDETYANLTPSARWWAMYGWVCAVLSGHKMPLRERYISGVS